MIPRVRKGQGNFENKGVQPILHEREWRVWRAKKGTWALETHKAVAVITKEPEAE